MIKRGFQGRFDTKHSPGVQGFDKKATTKSKNSIGRTPTENPQLLLYNSPAEAEKKKLSRGSTDASRSEMPVIRDCVYS